eukprot:7224845-Pyramimonas_sp.AAC.1
MAIIGSSTNFFMLSERAAANLSQEYWGSSGAAMRSAKELSILVLAFLIASPRPFTLSSPVWAGAAGIHDSRSGMGSNS